VIIPFAVSKTRSLVHLVNLATIHQCRFASHQPLETLMNRLVFTGCTNHCFFSNDKGMKSQTPHSDLLEVTNLSRLRLMRFILWAVHEQQEGDGEWHP
jgi:hypothetical protein